MKATDAALLAVIVAGISHAIKQKQFQPRHLIGALIFLGIIAFGAQAQPDVTRKFAYLVVVGVLLREGITVAKVL